MFSIWTEYPLDHHSFAFLGLCHQHCVPGYMSALKEKNACEGEAQAKGDGL